VPVAAGLDGASSRVGAWAPSRCPSI